MRNLANLKAREVEPDVYLPYVRHVTPTVISLSTRALMTTIRLEGVSFETADPRDLNDLHSKLNLLLRNIADERLALWTHVIRRKETEYPDGEFRSAFARNLDAKYRARMVEADLFRNDLMLTLVWHPGRDPAARAAAILSRLTRARSADAEVDADALKCLEDATRDSMASLERYGPRLLGLYDRNGLGTSTTSPSVVPTPRRGQREQ